MSQNIHLFHLLKQQVLICADIKYVLPGDCKVLAKQISTQTKLFVSETTLKRIYGFAKVKFETSLFTKNALACFSGYAGWEDYLNKVQTNLHQQEGFVQAGSGFKEKEQQITWQNKQLTELALIGSHELRRPIATILELLNLFDIASITDQQNREIIKRLQVAAIELDAAVQRIDKRASKLISTTLTLPIQKMNG